MSGSPSSSSGDQLPKKHFQVGRVLAAVFGIAVVGGVIFGMVEYINGMPATLVPASGRVTWDGQPVTIGAVMTQHVDDPFQSAIGAFDEEGRFELMTNGQPGAALGTHKVIVASYGPGMGTSPLVPQEYLKAESSPLSITISSDPQKNVFELEVIGEAPKSPQRGGGAGPPGGSPGGGNQGGGNQGGGNQGGGNQGSEGEPTPEEPAPTSEEGAAPSNEPTPPVEGDAAP